MRNTPKLSVRTLACLTLCTYLCVIGERISWAQVTWNIDNTTNIGGNAVTTVVGSPTVVNTPFGNGLQFDGNDGIIVNANPIAGAASFTIEMLFRPDPIGGVTAYNQPRVLHVQTANPPDHRATLETRVVGNQWYLDVFLKSQTTGGAVSSLALIEPNNVHPLGEWYNLAMTYDGSQLRAYVNGVPELSGPLSVIPIITGQTSLGMRHNQVNFFVGAIAKVRFTPSIVDPSDFLLSYVPGDFDRNGLVESADYDKWASEFGNSVAQAGDGADGNRSSPLPVARTRNWQRSRGPAAGCR